MEGSAAAGAKWHKYIADPSYLARHALTYTALFVVFLIVAFIVFSPVLANVTTTAPGTGGDVYQNLWDIWWVSYATFTLHSSIWYTNLVFPPIGASLAFQTMMPIGSLLSAPFQGVSLAFAYNVMFFASFAVSGITMFVLARYLTKNAYAAFVAGLAFSFSAFHFMQATAHIDWLFISWVPLAAYFFMRIARQDGGIWQPIGLGTSMVLAMFMGDVEQGIMVLMLLVVMFLAYLLFRRKRMLSRKFWIDIGIAAVATAVLGSFGFVPILHALLQPGALSSINQYNTPQTLQSWSDNLLSFFIPGPLNSILAVPNTSYVFGYDPTETTAYIGYTVLALSLYALYRDRRRAVLWAVIAALFGWVAVGPSLNIGTINTGIPGIYSALSQVPVTSVIREAGRFDLVVSMAMAVLAALGVSQLLSNQKAKRYAPVITIVIAALVVIEGSGIMTGSIASATTTPISVPDIYYGIANTPGNFSVLNLPLLPNQQSPNPQLYGGKALLYTAITHKPTVGAYLTRMNSTQQAYMLNMPLIVQAYNLQAGGSMVFESPIQQNYTTQTLLAMYNYNVGIVALDGSAYNQSSLNQIASYLNSVFGKPIVSNTTLAYTTSQAVSSSLFRSYVSYPVLSDWGSQYVVVNGSTRTLWVPLSYGAVITYAPYANETGIQNKIATGYSDQVNTTLSFQAEYVGSPANLVIESLDRYGHVHPIAQFSLTPSLRTYTANAVLNSGPRLPNTLFFMPSSATQGSYVVMSNITFSR